MALFTALLEEDELTDQLHLVGSDRTGVKKREGEKKRSHIEDHPSFPRPSFKVLQTQQGGKATKYDLKDIEHAFCMHLW